MTEKKVVFQAGLRLSQNKQAVFYVSLSVHATLSKICFIETRVKITLK